MGLDFASGSGYEDPMDQTLCCTMCSTHNPGIIPMEKTHSEYGNLRLNPLVDTELPHRKQLLKIFKTYLTLTDTVSVKMYSSLVSDLNHTKLTIISPNGLKIFLSCCAVMSFSRFFTNSVRVDLG